MAKAKTTKVGDSIEFRAITGKTRKGKVTKIVKVNSMVTHYFVGNTKIIKDFNKNDFFELGV